MRSFFSTLLLAFATCAAGSLLGRADNTSVGTTTPRLLAYVQTFHENGNTSKPLSLLPLLNEDTGITHVILAMTHLNTIPGEIHLNDNPYNSTIYDQTWSEVKKLQAAGVKVMVTMGGYGDGSYNHLATNVSSPFIPSIFHTNTLQFTAYYQPLLTILKKYNLDGIDLDIEEDVAISVPLKLIKALKKDLGSDFLISMAPVASALAEQDGGDLSGFSYFDLDKQAVSSNGTKFVSWYNAQFYSGFGSPESTSTYDEIVDAGWDPARVVMGVLDSGSDGSGFVALKTIQSTIASLLAKYPTFGGVDGWEYFDAGSSDGDGKPWEWVKSIGGSLFGTAAGNNTLSKKRIAKERGGAEFPESPFEERAIEELMGRGATHFEAVRALNRTSGEWLEARSLVGGYLARKASVGVGFNPVS